MSLKGDIKYVFMNNIINRIPSWHIRKALYSLSGLKIGVGARIGMKTIVVWPKKIAIGDRSVINEYCYIDGRGGLSIGNDCSISNYSKIITGTHNMNSNSFDYLSTPISIGDCVWIGTGAIVLNGSILKDGSVIGAGCVFKGTAEKNDVYIGNPAQLIKKRNLSDHYKIEFRPHCR